MDQFYDFILRLIYLTIIVKKNENNVAHNLRATKLDFYLFILEWGVGVGGFQNFYKVEEIGKMKEERGVKDFVIRAFLVIFVFKGISSGKEVVRNSSFCQ